MPAPARLSRFIYLRPFLYALSALGLTWPLIRQISTHLPLGTENAATVPLFNLWTLLWNADRLQHGFNGYWNAPIFYPEPGALALSEPQPLTGIFFALILAAVRNPIAAYNLVLLFILSLNAISADWLLRKIGVGTVPAFLGGLLALTLPFVGNELGVLQLTAVFPIFFTLGSIYTFSRNPRWLSAMSIGWWNGTAFLFSGYYGLFLTLFVPLGALCFFQRRLFRGKVILQLASGAVLAGLLLLPILEQSKLTAEYTRSETTIQNNSAELAEYRHLYRRTLGEQFLPWVAEDDGRQRLFPGTFLIILALAGLIVGIRSRFNRRWLLFTAVGALLAFILSLGLNLSIAEWQPYNLLKDHYPGFVRLRSPFRLAVFVQIFLVGLAGVGLHHLGKNYVGRFVKSSRDLPNRATDYSSKDDRWNAWARWLAAVLVALALLEVVALPTRLYRVPDEAFQAQWIDWLRQQPGEEAVLMLPMSENSSATAFEPIVIGMLQGLEHGRPLGNGYSGFFPTSYRSLKGRMVHFPDQETIDYLQSTGFGYLVIDQEWWDGTKTRSLTDWQSELTQVYEDDDKMIYRLQLVGD